MTSFTQPSVWAVAQQTALAQRRGRYLAESMAHPGKMLPALARQAIELYTTPGELVLDPMCGIGTTLVEAIHLGRPALGVELEPRWAALAARNLRLARAQGAPGQGRALQGDARHLGRGLLDSDRGNAKLILTSPPYGHSTHGHVRKHDGFVEKLNDRYSTNPDNLAHLPAQRARGRRPPFAEALAEILDACARMLAPGGHLVLTARPYRVRGALIDLPGQLTDIGTTVGLEPAADHVALLCAIKGERLVPRASFFQLQHQRRGAIPRMLLIAHEDVVVLRKPPRPRPGGVRR